MKYVISARYISEYRLDLIFSDGMSSIVDFEAELHGPMFSPLRDLTVFRQVVADSELRTLVWPNGADLAPEYLYDLALKTNSNEFRRTGA